MTSICDECYLALDSIKMEKIIATKYHKTPFGELLLGSYQEKICICDWRYRKQREAINERIKKGLELCQPVGGAIYIEQDSLIIEKTISQLEEYFNGNRQEFDLELHPIGTIFQKRVWQALQEIPFGSTISYQDLSERLGDKKAIRAVATANGANAISILIPCHRVIGKDGNLVGYAGGLKAKESLLKLEDALQTNQMNLF